MITKTNDAASGTATMDRGVLVVSIDTELAWGEADRRGRSGSSSVVQPSQPERSYDGEREAVASILDIFTRHQVTATWAVVGHLFLDECDNNGGRPHPEIVRPNYAWLDGDWFDIDPCTSLEVDPIWYGRDIVDTILACPVPQEIGSHSFSHMVVDDPACTPEVFSSELAAAVKVAGEREVELRSFVYPRNGVAHVECLAEHGYRSYRGKRPSSSFAGRSAWQQRVLRLADRIYPLSGSTAYPVQHASGVWNIPQSYYLFGPTKGRRWLPTFHDYRPIARMRQAARHRSVFHMWFHPHNVIAEPGAVGTLDRICAVAARLRDAGRIDVKTMGGLAAQLDAAESAS